MSGLFVFGNERDAPAVAQQAVVSVTSWRVIETPNGDRRLLIILDSGSLRITSPIADFDPAIAALTTHSGRVYKLDVPPEVREPQHSLLTANALRSGLANSVDVSDVIWQLTVDA